MIVRSAATAQMTALTVTQTQSPALTPLTQRLQKLVSSSQGLRPEDLRGHQHTVNNSRHTNANTNPFHDYKHNLEETEIIHIGRKFQNECAVMATIGNRSYKAPLDSVTAKCVLSLDCYQSISPKFKTELYESSIKIRAANGSFIKNRGECNLTFKINDEQLTFPFLCSDQLSQQLILGHNFAKAFHIGTSWDANDTISLTIN